MINQILKPNIEVRNIEISSFSDNELYIKEMGNKVKELGRDPLLWYNGIYIPPYLIDSFYLKSNEFLPSLEVYFSDETRTLVNIGFALDNTIISIYIDSRTKDSNNNPALRPIRMDFKITDFRYDEDSSLFYVYGVPNIDGLYLQKIKAYENMTSFEALQQISKDIKLGFATNTANTNDKMNWLNRSLESHTFIKDITKRAYKSDNTFFDSFIDFYYNLNFIDVEQCFKESLEQKGILTSMDEGMNEAESQIIEELFIVSSKHYQNRYNNVYESYEILNQSTKISLDNGYRTILHYYDKTGNWNQKAGSFLKFTIETNTDNKGITLKSSPNDTAPDGFFAKNSKRIYVQPLDISNTHKNFNYSLILNEYNNAELDKIKIVVTMRVPNFNFQIYQRIKVVVMNPVVGNDTIVNERLTGGWLIKEIYYYYTPEDGLKQELVMIKRELSAGNYTF